MKITGTPAVRGSAFMRRHTSKPSVSGMRTSRSTRSGLAKRAFSSACAPLRVSIRSNPCSARKSEIRRKFCGLSSTISTVAPRSSVGSDIAMCSCAVLQQRDESLLVEIPGERVQAASERAIPRFAPLQLQRDLLDAHQLAQSREFKQFVERGTGRRDELCICLLPHRRAPMGLGLFVAPGQVEQARDDIKQFRTLERLAQAGRESQRICFCPFEVRGAGGCCHYRHRSQFERLANGVGSLEAGHFRHAQIHHDQGRTPLQRGGNRCLSTRCGGDFESKGFEYLLKQLAVLF